MATGNIAIGDETAPIPFTKKALDTSVITDLDGKEVHYLRMKVIPIVAEVDPGPTGYIAVKDLPLDSQQLALLSKLLDTEVHIEGTQELHRLRLKTIPEPS